MKNEIPKSQKLLNRYQKIKRIATRLQRKNSNRKFKSLSDLNSKVYFDSNRFGLFN